MFNLKIKIMEIASSFRNCMGTMSFVLKAGKMKKAEEFTVYLLQKDDSVNVIYMQSEHRWLNFYPKTGEIFLSARRAQYANLAWLEACRLLGTAEQDKATESQVSEIVGLIRGTAGEKVGDNAMAIFCDNSRAAEL